MTGRQTKTMVIVNYGAGTNSTALLTEAVRKGIHIDAVVFADTGSELPRAYAYLDIISEWLRRHDIRLDIVRWIRKRGERAGQFIPLHVQSLERNEFPSKTYGFSGCTVKWKQQPVDEHVRVLAGESTVERWIGFDADEPGRWSRASSKPVTGPWTWRAPLIEWDMGRAECIESIKAAGLPLPGKSSCFMCPSMRRSEVAELAREHPEQFSIALEIERRGLASLRPGADIAGLGGRLNWASMTGETSLPPECACDDG